MRYLAMLRQLLGRHRAQVLALALTLAAGGAITFTIDSPDDSAPPMTYTLGGPGHGTVTVPPVAQQGLMETGAAEQNLHVEPPAAHDPQLLEHDGQLQPDGQPEIPRRLPQATPEVSGCQTRLVRNYSSREGSPVLLGVVHDTDSPPLLGWGGVNANTSWFDELAAQASSNEIMSRDGKCNLVVPEALKAWTQAGFNRVAVSVEVVTNGTPPTFMTPRGRSALARLVLGWHERWKLPLQRAVVSGCSVVRPGITDHHALGSCGGGHVDITPYDVNQVIDDTRALLGGRQASRSAVEQRIENGLAQPRMSGHSLRYWCTRNHMQRASIRRVARARRGGWDVLARAARYQELGHAFTRSCSV